MSGADLPNGLFRDLVDAASDFVGTIDRFGNIVYINPAGRRLLEIPPDEDIVGQSVLPYNEPPSEVLRAAAKILEDTGGQWTGVSYFVSRSGRRIPVSQMMVAHSTDGTNWYSTIAREITAQLQREEELRYRADHDALTGLLNRGAFRNGVALLNTAQSMLLAMIDIDRFKLVNDTRGHYAGDAVLQEVGRQLRVANDNSVLAARLGGDEFAVVLQAADEVELECAFQRLEAALQAALAAHQASASIGKALLPSTELLDQAMQLADARLYERKRQRREAEALVTESALRAHGTLRGLYGTRRT